MQAYERLLKYVTVCTTSDAAVETTPSTACQFDLAKLLVEEMKELGIADARMDEHGDVYGSIPATEGCGNSTALGFIAHLDTAPDFCGEHVKPQVILDYDGGEVKLGDSGLVLSPEIFPELSLLKGRTLITTDGTTLLGADDKAGIAEIMTAAEILIKSGRPHGKFCLAFTPDEEIGGGAAYLDLPSFGAQYAFTVDGGCENEITYETFNACEASFLIKGRSVHPGDSKNKMVNASLIAMEINAMLPAGDIPARTEMYEGFFHLTEMSGDVSEAKLHYIVRDHDQAAFLMRQKTLQHIEKVLNEKYGEGTVTLSIRQQYRNMVEKIAPCMHLVENAKAVIRELGMEPDVSPVRGGTDGSQLSFRGLPCPNIGTGGYAFHGPYEHITAEGMETAVKIILGITDRYLNGF